MAPLLWGIGVNVVRFRALRGPNLFGLAPFAVLATKLRLRRMNNIALAYGKFCRTRFPLPSDKEVAALEERIGISLPEDYREFLLKYNGGYFTEPDILPPSDDCPLDRLKVLHGIRATQSSAELASTTWLTLFDDNDPPQILPIGFTLMGNLLFLITHWEDNGAIGLKKAGSDDSFFLVEGIEQFFGLLRESSDDDE